MSQHTERVVTHLKPESFKSLLDLVRLRIEVEGKNTQVGVVIRDVLEKYIPKELEKWGVKKKRSNGSN